MMQNKIEWNKAEFLDAEFGWVSLPELISEALLYPKERFKMAIKAVFSRNIKVGEPENLTKET